jgi:hypothetical protein
MSSRNVGFSTKEAVASFMGAFREKHGLDGEVRQPEPMSRKFAAKASAIVVAELPSGYSIHELASESDLATETAHWRLDPSDQAALARTRGQRAFTIRSAADESESVIIVDRLASTIITLVTQKGAPPCIPNACHVGRALIAGGISIGNHLWRFAAIQDKEGRNHFIDSCPERLEIDKNAYIHSTEAAMLPKVIVADRDFCITDTVIVRNAVSANVRGSLGLRNLTGLTVPSHLNVGVDLSLQMSDADRLPMRFSVGRDLDIGLTPITELPDTFHVGRNIVANGASIARLRGGLTVRGNLDLRGCPLSEIPWGLEVGGDLNLAATNVRTIPGDAVIGGNLMVEEDVVVPSTLRLGGSLMYARAYGYEVARRPSN